MPCTTFEMKAVGSSCSIVASIPASFHWLWTSWATFCVSMSAVADSVNFSEVSPVSVLYASTNCFALSRSNET